jgi:hypothetical protein
MRRFTIYADDLPDPANAVHVTVDYKTTGLNPATWARWTHGPELDAALEDALAHVPWLGGKNAAGYGYFWLDGRLVSAHGHAYAEAYGPLPEGHEPDHLCENKGCVNPEHLEGVTGADNKRRGNLRRDRMRGAGA